MRRVSSDLMGQVGKGEKKGQQESYGAERTAPLPCPSQPKLAALVH